MAGHGVDQEELLKDLRKQVVALEDDLRTRSDEIPEFANALKGEYFRARKAERTAATYGAWRDERVTQAAAAWVLSTVFVRFCEDNGLIELPWIAGPGDRLALAEARHDAYFRDHPQHNDRDWLIASFDHLAACNQTATGLFDRNHNPLWGLTPSFEAATELLRFWRRVNSDNRMVHDFTDEELNTRFLGDLYQDLSEHARKTYALLQTPDFVEEFILDLTLDPAIGEFGLDPALDVLDGHGDVVWQHVGLRTIDPACGSGHFLLGLFKRILAARRAQAGTGITVDDWALIRSALESVHGCDKNPFAVSIARFRLLVAALKEAGVTRLDHAREFPINVAVGDSLLHGRGAETVTHDLFSVGRKNTFAYSTEDVWEFVKSVDLLGRGSYHVVVGNPPYITVKDEQENKNYRKAYDACAGKYALSVPFAQRIFELASPESAGFTGQITSNSFMKREFGKKLIEDFFRSVKLTHIIDTSGAYIPGHGTPTVILGGRNTIEGWADPIRAVLGVRGEPSQPENAAHGLVWRAIVEQVGDAESESEWITTESLERSRFADFPWSVSGGGAGKLMGFLEGNAERALGKLIESTGFHDILGDDEVFAADRISTQWKRELAVVRPLVTGDALRDWSTDSASVLWPYTEGAADDTLQSTPLYWPYRCRLRAGLTFGKTREERGMSWHEHIMLSWSRTELPFLLAFAFVATHNHFVLDRGGKVFNRSAPVIKLPERSTEGEHLGLLGVLNSSTACFWLKQVSHDKGSQGVNEGFKSQEWERFYEFTGTKLKEFPLPAHFPLDLSLELDALAQRLAKSEPSAVIHANVSTRSTLDDACEEHRALRRRMIALQEELDWQVYGLYRLLNDAENAVLAVPADVDVPEVALGERAFEIVLARKMATREAETAWFARHGSKPITEIPAHWPESYRLIVQARIDVIEKRRDIALIERPECKRRWATESWEKKERAALRTWLLDRCEERSLWFHTRDGIDNVPRTLTVAELADTLADSPAGAAVVSVAGLYAADHLGKRDVRLAEVLREVLADEHVPYLAALRYKDPGLRKRVQWEEVWAQQREEDRTGERLDIPVPPKYTSADFRKQSYWSQRGKLDVPKERFISYPDAGPASDPSLVLGWAGWDHKDQSEAILRLVEDRVAKDGWTAEQVTPLLAGFLELMPWVKQWHGDYDEAWGGNPAEEDQRWLDDQRLKHQLSLEALRAWRPGAARRGPGGAK